MAAVLIGYEPGPYGDDARALGGAVAEVLGVEPEVLTVVEGQPAHELARVAEEAGTEVIVIGACHRSALGRIALGSVGAALIHEAPCAVAVAPRGYAGRESRRLLKVAVAYDGGVESKAALRTAIEICGRTRARLSILTAADVSSRVSAPMPAGGGPAVIATEQQAMQGVLRTGLDLVPEGLPVDGRLVIGPAASEIAEAASEADLLVVGSRSHGALGRTVLGSVATDLIHRAECPVMVIPRSAAGTLPDSGR